MYYRAFEILFNPFTEVLYVAAIVLYFNRSKMIISTVSASLLFSCVLMHGGLFGITNYYSSYKFLENDGKSVDPTFKITSDDYFLALAIREAEIVPEDEQLTVITHAEGMKTFFPNMYQMFTRKQYYDVSSRVNLEFYEMARRHYGWMEFEPIDYSNACQYIQQYHVDMAIINFYENWDFNEAIDACMVTVLTKGNYNVKVSK